MSYVLICIYTVSEILSNCGKYHLWFLKATRICQEDIYNIQGLNLNLLNWAENQDIVTHLQHSSII